MSEYRRTIFGEVVEKLHIIATEGDRDLWKVKVIRGATGMHEDIQQAGEEGERWEDQIAEPVEPIDVDFGADGYTRIFD